MSIERNNVLIIECDDGYLYRKNRLWSYLIGCYIKDIDAVIDFNLEGSAAHEIGLYDILDNFCESTGYHPHRIKILTGNLLEQHEKYQIERCVNYLFEIPYIQKWYNASNLNITLTPQKHFGCFVGQSRWHRAWTVSSLYKKHGEKTLLTYHTGFSSNYRTRVTDGVYDWLGIDEMNQHGCDIIPDVSDFLSRCPITLDDDQGIELENIFSETGYPLRHPANLTISKFYSEFFVDIVIETNMSGNAFFPTEKIWRSMITGRPFIVISNYHYLTNLRRLGFKTFGQYWDESYDSYGYGDRIRLALSVIDDIAQWNIAKLHQTLMSMQDILQHNRSRFMELKFSEIKKEFVGE